jgi:DNA-binding NarL/FixJ family response regulator
MEDSPAFAQLALDAGAIGFVLKEMADADLPEAVRRAARGEQYVSPRVAASMTTPGKLHRHDCHGVREMKCTPSRPSSEKPSAAPGATSIRNLGVPQRSYWSESM